MSQAELQKAHDLIEQGKFEQARQLLQTLDDPTARLWLAQLNASRRPRKQQLDIPLPLLVGVALVIGVGALIVIILLTPTLLTRMRNQSAPTATLSIQDQISSAVANFCAQEYRVHHSDDPSQACGNWTLMVLQSHPNAAIDCMGQSSDSTAYGQCLLNAGVPPPP
ncbi:MAG TPA: hypothetical protein VHD90_06110 [Phototrophicaceae bacterium]|nr:hypothetical protein [Phototrophicaceae bacterium]